MMSAYQHTQETAQAAGRNRARRRLLLLVVLFVAPLVASWGLYLTRDYWQLSMKNHGALVQPPRPLARLILRQIDGGQLTVEALRGKWTLVYLGGAECSDACDELLYHMQQIRLALGEDMQRVQRLYLVPDDADSAELRSIARRYPGMLVATADPGMRVQVEDQFGGPAEGPVIYLVDPLGNVMMRYGQDLDAKGVLKDLERLLKVSRVG